MFQWRENNVTIMLVSVVMVFIVCQVPALIYNMAYSISMETVTSSQAWEVLSTFRNFLVNLNSAINFILYCALGQKFRRTFVRTFCPCIARRSRDGFHSFTGTFHGDGFGHNGSNKSNATVYIKMLQQRTVSKNGNVDNGGRKPSLPKANGTKVNKSEVKKVVDQDSGVVMRRYSQQLSVESTHSLYDTHHLVSKGKIKTCSSERQLLTKSKEGEDV